MIEWKISSYAVSTRVLSNGQTGHIMSPLASHASAQSSNLSRLRVRDLYLREAKARRIGAPSGVRSGALVDHPSCRRQCVSPAAGRASPDAAPHTVFVQSYSAAT